MDKLKFIATKELPSTSQPGTFHITGDGSYYLTKSDKSFLKITDLLFVENLPTIGLKDKLYVLSENDSFKIYAWNGTGFKSITGSANLNDTDLVDLKNKITQINTKLITEYSKNNHKHDISEINDLVEELNSKVKNSDFNLLKLNFENHIHNIADIPNLESTLAQTSKIGHKHPWSDITDKPSSTIREIDEAVVNSHQHTNIQILNNLEDGNGVLIYNGNPLGEVSYIAVETLADRDNLPMSVRKEGLLALIVEDESMYYLKGGVDNAFWKIFATGEGGATTASTLLAVPTGELKGLNVQALIDELEVNKADLKDVYSKAEIENKLTSLNIDYFTLDNLPDLSSIHDHDNKATLDLFNQYQGNLTWKGKTLGDLVTEVYDADKDGVIDVAQTLYGLTSTIAELNQLNGVTGNIQNQINSLTSGVTFRGEFDTFAEMESTITVPQKGDLVYIKIDETKNDAEKTQYCHDGDTWVYGGGNSKLPEASATTKGVMGLGGDLAHPNSTASAPKLTPTGVVPGLYKTANVTVGEDGRISHVEEGNSAFLNDEIVSESEGWSSNKIEQELNKRSKSNHTHDQLHNANMMGSIELNEEVLPSNNFVPSYNALTGKAEWKEQQGGKVYVGSKYIKGDYTLKAGSYITLSIDDVTKEITINSTYRENGGNIIPTGFEVSQSVLIPSGESLRFSVDSTFNKVMLHTLQMVNDKNVTGEVRLYNQAEGGFVEYNSNPEIFVSDIVNIPIFDNDNSKMLHFEIDNTGIEDATFTIRAKCTNLL